MVNDFHSEILYRFDRLAAKWDDAVDGISRGFTNRASTLEAVDKVDVEVLSTDYGRLKELKDNRGHLATELISFIMVPIIVYCILGSLILSFMSMKTIKANASYSSRIFASGEWLKTTPLKWEMVRTLCLSQK